VLDRVCRRDRDLQGARIGVADVSEARTIIRRAMKRGSSPPSSIAAR